ncbi:DNA cytosine methyltransferase, partial [bacterium]|nr:DNA cytosine methyltransferase [bacterium]
MKETNKKLTAVDLFSGAGGLSLGFEKGGFRVIFAVENDVYSAQTYKLNRKKCSTELILSDISQINFVDVLRKFRLKKGEIDILLCGAPCQGFSISNMRTRSSNNPRNHLFKEFLRAVKEIYPKWILFENVPGIVSFEKGKVIQAMNEELTKHGYKCIRDVINA